LTIGRCIALSVHGVIGDIGVPLGRLITKIIPNTAGNSNTEFQVPAGKRWLFQYGIIHYNADSTSVTRNVTIKITDKDDNLLAYVSKSQNIAADENLNHCILQNIEGKGDLQPTYTSVTGIGKIILNQTDKFKIIISNGQAGDQYSGYIRFLEIDI